MNRSQRVLEVYRELRCSAAVDATAEQTLACAASLVELFDENDDSPQFGLRTGRVPFDMQPLDVALADGGWRVLNREWKWLGMDFDEGCGGRRSTGAYFG